MSATPPYLAFLEPEAWPLTALLFGLVVGSFANVLIHRLPREESISFPPSHCPKCDAPIRPFDNLPVLSYLLLRGRCRSCRAPIAWRYPAVEAANGLLWMAVALDFGPGARSLFAMALCTALLALALIDLEHQLLPDKLTLPLLAAALVLSFLPGWPVPPLESFLSAAGGFSLMAGIAVAGQSYYGEEALGQGDWKLTAMLGAALGWRLCLLSVFLGSLLGALVGIGLRLRSRGGSRTKIPFGTFLVLGALIALFFGRGILAWYSGFFDGAARIG